MVNHTDVRMNAVFGALADSTRRGMGQPPMDTRVVFEIEPDGQRTRLSFTHTGFATESREQHRMGWTGSMARLTEVVE